MKSVLRLALVVLIRNYLLLRCVQSAGQIELTLA